MSRFSELLEKSMMNSKQEVYKRKWAHDPEFVKIQKGLEGLKGIKSLLSGISVLFFLGVFVLLIAATILYIANADLSAERSLIASGACFILYGVCSFLIHRLTLLEIKTLSKMEEKFPYDTSI